MVAHAAVTVGLSLWLVRRLDGRSAEPDIDRLGDQVHRLVGAHEALAEVVDRRLRSVEESAARAEAEARFTATLTGDHAGPRPTLTDLPGAAGGPEARHGDG